MEADDNGDPRVRDRKRARLGEAHVAPIVALCDEIASERRLLPGAVPYPDPEHAGIRARALFVLSHPGARAPYTRFLSLANDDDMSHLALFECRRVGIRTEEIAHWNAVPFPPATGKVRGPEKADGVPWLARMVALLPALEVVALLGGPAQEAWPRAFPNVMGVAVVPGPSPGWPGISRPGARESLAAAFEKVAAALGEAR